jgi:hypothetical protein
MILHTVNKHMAVQETCSPTCLIEKINVVFEIQSMQRNNKYGVFKNVCEKHFIS